MEAEIRLYLHHPFFELLSFSITQIKFGNLDAPSGPFVHVGASVPGSLAWGWLGWAPLA